MALPMTHLLCAHRYALLHAPELYHTPEFYLGSIAPDAIHMREGNTPEDKRVSHLLARGIRRAEEYMPLVRDFLARYNNASEKARALAFGYGLHVVTDRIWVDYYCENCPELLDDEGKTIKERYYNDTDQVDFLLWQKDKARPFLWEMLKAAEAYDTARLTSEEIDGWRYRTLDYFEGKESEHRNEIRYLTEERVKKFIDSSDLRLDEYMTPLLSREKMTV